MYLVVDHGMRPMLLFQGGSFKPLAPIGTALDVRVFDASGCDVDALLCNGRQLLKGLARDGFAAALTDFEGPGTGTCVWSLEGPMDKRMESARVLWEFLEGEACPWVSAGATGEFRAEAIMALAAQREGQRLDDEVGAARRGQGPAGL